MSDAPNPFASPSAEASEETGRSEFEFNQELMASGGKLKAVLGARFPDRCVKCNASADGYRLRRALAWHPGWVYILLLIAIPIYFLVAFGTRKEAVYYVGLCSEHRRKRRRWQIAWWSVALASVSGVVLAFQVESVELGLFSFFAAVVSLIVAGVGSQVVSAAEITPQHSLLKDCGPEFMLSLG